MLGKECRRRAAGPDVRVRDEPAQERQVRRHAFDDGLRQRRLEPVERIVARRPVRDELRDHRVVRERDLVALRDARVDADRLRQDEPRDAAALRQERARVLGVETHLDRMAMSRGLSLGQRLSGRDAQLLRDEVESRDELGDRVLDLDAAVQLEEVEVAAVEHELGRAGARVADRAREAHGRIAHRRAEQRIERRRRRFLEHLLVPPLDRALALAERDHVAVRVAEQLDLDVPRPLDVALCEHAVVAERRLRLAPRRLERVRQLVVRAHDAHAAPAAAGRRLEEQREPELLRLAGLDDRHARLGGDPLRLELVAAGAQRVGSRADPNEPGGVDRLCEIGALGEEPVAGMDRVGARLLRRADVLLRVQVRRDLDRLVGRARVQRAAVVGRDDRDRADAQRTARPEDAHRDLAAVRHEQLADLHRPAA